MKTNHLTIDASQVRDVESLIDEAVIERLLYALAEIANAQVMGDGVVHQRFSPDESERHFLPGVTSFAILSTSHVSYHSFLETEGFALDLYSCAPFEPGEALALVKTVFGEHPDSVYATNTLSRR